MQCIMCQKDVPNDATSLLGYAFCPDCESLIVGVEADQPEYQHILEVIRSIWCKKIWEKGEAT